MSSEYAAEYAKRLQAIGKTFQDMRSKQKEQNIFAEQFNVEPADEHDGLRLT